jgi:hypothetical protein
MPYSGLYVCLLGSNLNAQSKPEKLRPSRETIGIYMHLLKVKFVCDYKATAQFSGEELVKHSHPIFMSIWYISMKVSNLNI